MNKFMTPTILPCLYFGLFRIASIIAHSQFLYLHVIIQLDIFSRPNVIASLN